MIVSEVEVTEKGVSLYQRMKNRLWGTGKAWKVLAQFGKEASVPMGLQKLYSVTTLPQEVGFMWEYDPDVNRFKIVPYFEDMLVHWDKFGIFELKANQVAALRIVMKGTTITFIIETETRSDNVVFELIEPMMGLKRFKGPRAPKGKKFKLGLFRMR